MSPTVPIKPGNVILLTAGNEIVSPAESASVPQSPKALESATVQESNPHLECRIRGRQISGDEDELKLCANSIHDQRIEQ